MEVDPFPASDFDGWASSYDQDVLDESRFPFLGYQQVLETVVRLAEPRRGMRVLDLGTGTGNLAARFAAMGCEVWATDFSADMLGQARAKLPQVRFIQADVRQGWAIGEGRRFDRIVSAYVFHHFELLEKARLAAEFASYLALQGKLVLADIAFPDQAGLEAVRQRVGADWEEEFYWLADEARQAFQQVGLVVRFYPVSLCAGVFEVQVA